LSKPYRETRYYQRATLLFVKPPWYLRFAMWTYRLHLRCIILQKQILAQLHGNTLEVTNLSTKLTFEMDTLRILRELDV
jgi:hypothetical protein